MRELRRCGPAVIQSGSDAVTGIMGARRWWTVSMVFGVVDALQADRGDAEVAVADAAG
jgi:hypothetical protein